MIKRADDNLGAIADWVGRTDWVDFLARDPAKRSSTSVCLKIVAPWFTALDAEAQAAVPKAMVAALEDEGAAYDIDGYRAAPPGLRVWAGSTVERNDLEALFPWLDWAAETVQAKYATGVGERTA